jgi:hypothetical protein
MDKFFQRFWTCWMVSVFFLSPGYTADLSWIQTARVFLVDAYQYPFAPELEFDAEAIAAAMDDMHVNTIRISTMGKYATIQGVRFATHPDQGDRDLLAEMIAACKPHNIRVIPYISTGHKLAWSMVTRDYPEYAHVAQPGGGPLRQHMFVGEDHGTICWSTPYRQAYLELVEHVVRDYDIDALYFDTWRPMYFWKSPRVCYCDGCTVGFRNISGRELPWHEEVKDYTAEELKVIDRYHAWQMDELVEVLREVRRIVKSHKDIPLIYNINNPQKIVGEDPRILEQLDAFLYERGDSMLERAEGVSLARAAGLYVWPYIGGYHNWPRAVYSGLDYQQEIFTTAMFGGGSIVAQPTGFFTHLENRHIVRYPFGVIEKQARYFRGFDNVPHVVVIYGFRDPPGHEQSGWFWNTNVRNATLGAFAACLSRHIQVSSALETLLDQPDLLAKYKVLYLADIPHLTPRRIENVRRFVERGGGLIVSYGASLYDAEGKRLERFGLEDVIRVAPAQVTRDQAHDIDNYVAMMGGPNDLYLVGRENAWDGNWNDRLVPAWHYEPVQALPGGDVTADIVRGDGMRPLLPGVVQSHYGAGRVVYLASALESLYGQNNMRVLGEFVEHLIDEVSSVQAPYIVDAPERVITNMTMQGQTRVLHLTNWLGNKFERNRGKEYYIAPIENIRIAIPQPTQGTIRFKQALVNANVQHRDLGDRLEIIIPRLEAYQGIVLTLEE